MGMMCHAVLLGVALQAQQQPSPLARAESLLAEGDTGAAIRALESAAVASPNMAETALGALFALQWIGRGGPWQAAHSRWKSQADRLVGSPPGNTAARTLLLAHFLEREAGLLQRVAQQVAWPGESHAAAVERFLRAIRDSTGPTPSLAAGAAAWALAEYHLDLAQLRLLEVLPAALPYSPVCPASPDGGCFIRGDPPANARSFRALAGDDSIAIWLARADTGLRAAALAPWPFSEAAARTIVAKELLFGTDSSRLTLRPWLAGLSLNPRTKAMLDVAVLAFSGRSDSAAAVMERNPSWFAPFDTAHTELAFAARLPADALWRTGWPLYLEPFNERLVVHRARRIAADLLWRALPPDSAILGFASTAAGIVARGIPVAFQRAPTIAPGLAEVPRVGLVPFLDPRTHETLLPASSRGEEVSLDLGLAARSPYRERTPSGYVDDHFDVLARFEHQVARYVESGRIVAELYAVRPPPECKEPRPLVGLFVLDERLRFIRQTSESAASGASPRHRYRLDLEPGHYVYSLEMLDGSCRQAARARYVLTVPAATDGLTLSDVVIADGLDFEMPERVVAQRPMTPSAGLTATAGGPLRLYWEVYGAPADAPEDDRLEVTLRVVDTRSQRVPVRLLPELARSAARTAPTLDLRYRALVPAGQEPLAMRLAVLLPGDAEGVYVVRVEVRDRVTGRIARAERPLYVTPRGSE